MVSHHPLYIQVFNLNQLKSLSQISRQLMQEIFAVGGYS